MYKKNGIILYENISLYDGSPVVAIMTGTKYPSRNPKTGTMLQVWILRADMHPVEALRNGGDASICGDCKHRPNSEGKRSCYVNPMSFSSVWKAYKAGKYAKLSTGLVPEFGNISLNSIVKGRDVRIGAYGDPAVIPANLWRHWFRSARLVTGYTHLWKSISTEYAEFCMASVDTAEEKEEAVNLGYRTFRCLDENDSLMYDEITCPASKEGGFSSSCDKCGLCSGSMDDRNNTIPSIAITVHGVGAKHFKKSVESTENEQRKDCIDRSERES